MKYSYPFKYDSARKLLKLRKNQDYYIWVQDGLNLKKLLSNINKPIIEIGGPTDTGYYFLNDVDFRSKVLITNISANPLPHAKNAKKLADMVDELVDGTKMPYKDSSVGLFLISGMSLASDWWLSLSDSEIEKRRSGIDKTYDEAELEQDQYAIGTLPIEEVKYAQRLKIYLEIYRCLEKNGLLVANGSLDDIVSLKNMGFIVISYLQIHARYENWSGMEYEFVAQKKL